LVLAFYCQLNVSTLSFLKVLRIFTRSAQFSFCFSRPRQLGFPTANACFLKDPFLPPLSVLSS
jgi:hypothetical protein